MIKVQWNDFARRRNLQLEKFIETMSYNQYKRWCEYRSVVPVDEASYIVNTQVKDAPPVEIVEEPRKEYTRKELTKMLKADVTSVATDLKIDLDGTETKKKIISLILGLNKS